MNTDPGKTTLDAAWMAIARLGHIREDVAGLARFLGLPEDTAPLLVIGAARDIIGAFRAYHPEHAANELRLARRVLTPREPSDD